jgi:hypothetical protein
MARADGGRNTVCPTGVVIVALMSRWRGAMTYEDIGLVIRAGLGRLLIYYPDNADGNPLRLQFSGSRNCVSAPTN